MKLLLALNILASIVAYGEGANILFFFGISTYSHRIAVWPLVQKLSENGHNITFFSPHPPKNNAIENVIEFSPKALIEKIKLDFDFLNIRIGKGVEEIEKVWFSFPPKAVTFCESMVSDPEVLSWVNSSHYDLVFIDSVFNDCGFGFAHKFKAKRILFGTSSQFSWWPDTYTLPDESATYPEHTLHLPQKMSFYQRMQNSLRSLYWYWYNRYIYYPAIETVLRTSELDISDLPPLAELHKGVNLIFANSHFSEEYPRSFPPSVVEIGGMQCTDKTNKLPKDILDFIDGAGENPVVYISFGSFVQYSKMPDNLKKVFIDTFKKFSHTRFLWKFDGERPEDIPNNVLTRSWMPQQDVLAHPKIKVFVSHGGKLGSHEAIFHGVPMIVIPIFAEQDYNAEKIHSHGHGLRLEIATLTLKKFETAINDILTNKIYTEKMQKMSKEFRDRPSKPVDTALWWTDYVLRHKDTAHLHPYSHGQTWYQRRQLDVWIFLYSLSVMTLLLAFFILRKAFYICASRKLKTA